MSATHFVGIGGIHMSALAHILLDDGERVSGCDRADSGLIEDLRRRGAEIAIGHDPSHAAAAHRMIRTVAVPEDHPEIAAARSAGLPVLTRAELLAEIARGRRVIAVSGSHGKSTTTAMLAAAMRAGGRDAGYVLGGETAGISPHARRGADEWLVLEADEYGRAFHHYEPQVAAITNIEPDHLDYYGDFAALLDAFERCALTLQPGGTLVFDASSVHGRRVAARVAAERGDIRLVRTGLAGDDSERDWEAGIVSTAGRRTTFALSGPAIQMCGSLRVPGEFNVRNALLALASAHAAGFDLGDAAKGISAFEGVRRRFQLLGEAAGVQVIDDYAHHPTEVAATIAAARDRFPGRRLILAFQPHTYSRTRYLLDQFRGCFAGADRLLIADTYAAREEPDQGLDAAALAAAVEAPPAEHGGSVAETAARAADAAQPGDIVITMGAGDIEAAGPLILARLRGARS